MSLLQRDSLAEHLWWRPAEDCARRSPLWRACQQRAACFQCTGAAALLFIQLWHLPTHLCALEASHCAMWEAVSALHGRLRRW